MNVCLQLLTLLASLPVPACRPTATSLSRLPSQLPSALCLAGRCPFTSATGLSGIDRLVWQAEHDGSQRQLALTHRGLLKPPAGGRKVLQLLSMPAAPETTAGMLPAAVSPAPCCLLPPSVPSAVRPLWPAGEAPLSPHAPAPAAHTSAPPRLYRGQGPATGARPGGSRAGCGSSAQLARLTAASLPHLRGKPAPTHRPQTYRERALLEQHLAVRLH